MRYQKFVCKDKNCRARNHNRPRVWYRHNTSGAHTRLDAGTARCPSCRTTMRCAGIQKSVPKRGVLLGSALAQRSNPFRARRRAAIQSQQRLRRQKLIAKRRGLLIDDEDDDPLGLNVTIKGDEEYAPPPKFNPYLRLTSGSQRRTARSKMIVNNAYTKPVGKMRITTSHTRAMSSTNQNAVMGGRILGTGKSLSAWKHAGRTPYKKNRYKSAEWCHLVGDCLGGPTAVYNLVAASFAANTEMMAIENLLMGKTHLRVLVAAYCKTEHVAECIRYHVYCNKGHHWRRKIDGSNDFFTRDDLEDLREDLKDFLTTHKNC